jgi:hypothetical protein
MNPDPMSNAFEIFRQMAAASLTTGQLGAQTSAAPARPSAFDEAQRRLLLQLYLAAINSGCRYMMRWAKISGEYYPELAQALLATIADPAGRGRELGATIDGLRAFLREMAELPLDESKRLQTDIEAILAAGGSEGETTPAAPPKRRARVKE